MHHPWITSNELFYKYASPVDNIECIYVLIYRTNSSDVDPRHKKDQKLMRKLQKCHGHAYSSMSWRRNSIVLKNVNTN